MSPLNDLNSIETSAVECSNEDKPTSSQSTSNYNVIENKDIQFSTSTPDEIIQESTFKFLRTWFPSASINNWNDWRWQLKNSFTKPEQLSFLLKDFNDVGLDHSNKSMLPLRITPYYASLLHGAAPDDPLRKSIIPSAFELMLSKGESIDPLNEENDSPVANVIHRYPDRVLFLSTGFCSAYCRYCTRTHIVSKKDKCHTGVKAWEPGLAYIAAHPEIRDVVISGGDPLTMSDSHIKYLLMRLRAINHIEIIRIGTKVPVVLPMRITKSLVSMLRRFHPLYMSIHFTHPSELTKEASQACKRLADAGIPLGSQTVLLKGINDDVATMTKLMQGLLKIRVKPYYIYQCDPIPGSAHFRTSINKGIEIIKGLRGHTSGYAVPQYVIDAPGGGGKIPLLPEYYKGHDDQGRAVLENYQGMIYYYPDNQIE